MTATRDPMDRDRTAERLKGSARRGVRRLRERFDDVSRTRATDGSSMPGSTVPATEPDGDEDASGELAAA